MLGGCVEPSLCAPHAALLGALELFCSGGEVYPGEGPLRELCWQHQGLPQLPSEVPSLAAPLSNAPCPLCTLQFVVPSGELCCDGHLHFQGRNGRLSSAPDLSTRWYTLESGWKSGRLHTHLSKEAPTHNDLLVAGS